MYEPMKCSDFDQLTVVDDGSVMLKHVAENKQKM
jgi:hypothetical protein